jgi:hypothetical protein
MTDYEDGYKAGFEDAIARVEELPSMQTEELTVFEADGHDYVKGPRNLLRVELRQELDELKEEFGS